MKKLLWIIGSIVVFLIVVFIAGFLQFIRGLPSPQVLAKTLNEVQSPSNSVASPNQVTQQKKIVQNSSKQESNPISKSETSATDKAKGLAMIKSMMTEPLSDIHVCDNLGSTQYFKNKDIGNLLLSQDRLDSVGEAYRYPLKAIFQDPLVAGFFNELENYKTDEMGDSDRKDFLEKMGFYSRMAVMSAHLFTRKDYFEYLGNRANHLAVIARIAALKPELAQKPEVKDFCYQLQNSMATNQTSDVKEERKELMKLISYSGLTPAQLDFDPDQFIKFGVHTSKDSLRFTLGSKENPTN